MANIIHSNNHTMSFIKLIKTYKYTLITGVVLYIIIINVSPLYNIFVEKDIMNITPIHNEYTEKELLASVEDITNVTPLYNRYTEKELLLSVDKPSNYHLVLAWTTMFRNPWPYTNSFDQFKCKYSNCVLTTNKSLLNKSDAVLFHWIDVTNNYSMDDIPQTHYANQIWILYSFEAAIHAKYKESLQQFYNQINWTMTYRSDSDVLADYGEIVKCNRNNRKPRYQLKQKTKSIVWMVSNCNTTSKREKYVAELKKYIDIDIYGRCGELKCGSRSIASCITKIERNYKFYLSFENSICKEYVTEKLFQIIQRDIIPVVMGGANYSSFMPPNSYIDVFNFSSPKLLAQYLTDVGNDEQLYNSYFSWKSNYCSVVKYHDNHYCDLCYKLNFAHSFQTRWSSSKLRDWWYGEGNCSNIQDYYLLNKSDK